MTSTAATPTSVEVQKPSSSLFWVGVLIAFCWILFVAVLTWKTANPVTVNRLQVLSSEFVVTGQVLDDRTKSPVQYLIEPVAGKQWPFPNREPVEVSNLPETGAQIGQVYLFPLTKPALEQGVQEHGEYIVTPSHLPNSAPLIYPATPDAMQQLERILTGKPDSAALQPRLPAARD